MLFATARLLVRRLRDSDLEHLVSVYGDAAAMRWVGDGGPLDRSDCMRWLDVTRANYERRGYGMFTVERRSSQQVIGFCGLVHPGGQAEPEVKYAYHRLHWGSGFATEALVALLTHGASAHGLQLVIATAAPENVASHKVLIKAGMTPGPLRREDDATQTQLFHWTPAAISPRGAAA